MLGFSLHFDLYANKKTEYFKLTDPDLKKATIDQLKKCIANSPYMK